MVAPLRVAQVTATFPPYLAGTGQVCLENARALAARGHEVDVLTASQPGAPAQEAMAGIHVHHLPAPWRLGNAPLLPGLVRRLQGYDLIHLQAPFVLGAELARLAAWRSGAPLVITWHNDLIAAAGRGAILAAYQALTARLTVRGAALLCVVSLDYYAHSRLRRQLGAAAPEVVELPNGVDTARFHPDGPADVRRRLGIPDDVVLFCFVAALDRAHDFKGLERLLAAMASLPETAWLVVVGDGERRAHYERQAAARGLGPRVRFVGNVAHGALPAFYRVADLTVLPSAVHESFGLVLVESLACGTPVVASELPGVRTVVDPGADGFLVPPGDSAALRATLAAALALPPARRREMGLAGRRKVLARYDWERIGARLEACYVQVLARRAAPTAGEKTA